MDGGFQVTSSAAASQCLSYCQRKFVAIGVELRKTNSIRAASRQQGTLNFARTGAATGAVLEEMAAVNTSIHL